MINTILDIIRLLTESRIVYSNLQLLSASAFIGCGSFSRWLDGGKP